MTKNNKEDYEPISDEELVELVLETQREALEKEREIRLKGEPVKKKKIPLIVKIITWLMVITLAFSTFATIFEIYSIPAIEFLKTSARLSSQQEVQTYKKAVVEISTGEGKGTGFSISDDGYIVTNEHVVEDALSIIVTFPDDGLYEAEVVKIAPEVDLAILKIEGENFPHLSLVESYEYKPNEHVMFIGNPLYFTGIANEGSVLKPILLSDWEHEVYMMDAPVYRGNSGSPIINEEGGVVGIIFATLKHDEFGKVGLFIPVELLQEQMRHLKSHIDTSS